MKKLAAAVFAIAASLNIMAQTVTVSPLPQKITWGEKAFDKGTQVKMTTGVVKDKKVRAYKKLVPTQAESYYLKVTPSEVIVTAQASSTVCRHSVRSCQNLRSCSVKSQTTPA